MKIAEHVTQILEGGFHVWTAAGQIRHGMRDNGMGIFKVEDIRDVIKNDVGMKYRKVKKSQFLGKMSKAALVACSTKSKCSRCCAKMFASSSMMNPGFPFTTITS